MTAPKVTVIRPPPEMLAHCEWWLLGDLAPNERCTWKRIRARRQNGWAVQRALCDMLLPYY